MARHGMAQMVLSMVRKNLQPFVATKNADIAGSVISDADNMTAKDLQVGR